MSFYRGPKIPIDNLIFALDVSNHKCLATPVEDARSSLTSLVTTSVVEGASGTPLDGTHTPDSTNMPKYISAFGGVLDFDGRKGMNVVEDLGTHTAMTYSFWVKWHATLTNDQYFVDARSNGGVWYFQNYASYNVNWNSNLRYNFGGGTFDANKWLVDEWINLIVSSDSTDSQVWVNGSNRTSDAAANTSTNENLGKNLRIGTRHTTSDEFAGLMGPVHFYNTKFTDEKALMMYNAYRERFSALPYDALATKAGW